MSHKRMCKQGYKRKKIRGDESKWKRERERERERER